MPADSKFEVLKNMIQTSKLDYEGKTVAMVNKLQKWACVQKIAACVSSKVEEDEVAALADGLLAEDSSDVAQLQYAKYQCAVPLEQNKVELFNKIKAGEIPQQKLMAIAPSFYNHANPSQCDRFAWLWLASIEKVEASQHRDYFLEFFVGLSPKCLRD